QPPPDTGAARQPPRPIPPHHLGEVAVLFQNFLDGVPPSLVGRLGRAPKSALKTLLKQAYTALFDAADRAQALGLAAEIEALPCDGTGVEREAVRLLRRALQVARCAAALRGFPVGAPIRDPAALDAQRAEFDRAQHVLLGELATWLRNPEQHFAELHEALSRAVGQLTGWHLGGEAAQPEVAPAQRSDAADSEPATAGEGRRQPLTDFAVATEDGTRWHLYHIVRGRWRRWRAIAFAGGQQSKLIGLFARSGGTAGVNEAVLALWGSLPKDTAELNRRKG